MQQLCGVQKITMLLFLYDDSKSITWLKCNTFLVAKSSLLLEKLHYFENYYQNVVNSVTTSNELLHGTGANPSPDSICSFERGSDTTSPRTEKLVRRRQKSLWTCPRNAAFISNMVSVERARSSRASHLPPIHPALAVILQLTSGRKISKIAFCH